MTPDTVYNLAMLVYEDEHTAKKMTANFAHSLMPK